MRKSPIDTDDILYGILNSTTELTQTLSGGIYVGGERPDNSGKEDICINTLSLSMDTMPQTGTSNVNIHVPDIKVTINGQQQYKQNRERMRELTDLVTAALDAAVIDGAAIRISNSYVIPEETNHSHYNNLRVEWNIAKGR